MICRSEVVKILIIEGPIIGLQYDFIMIERQFYSALLFQVKIGES